jgi:hypothetical protein
MSKLRKRQESRPVILSRQVRITTIDACVRVRAEKPRGLPAERCSHPCLELQGLADEPLRDVHEFSIHLHVDDSKEPGPALPPAVGAIIQVRPQVQAVIGLTSADFDRVWTLATSGHLRYSRLAFTEPRRRTALIVSASFSKAMEE